MTSTRSWVMISAVSWHHVQQDASLRKIAAGEYDINSWFGNTGDDPRRFSPPSQRRVSLDTPVGLSNLWVWRAQRQLHARLSPCLPPLWCCFQRLVSPLSP